MFRLEYKDLLKQIVYVKKYITAKIIFLAFSGSNNNSFLRTRNTEAAIPNAFSTTRRAREIRYNIHRRNHNFDWNNNPHPSLQLQLQTVSNRTISSRKRRAAEEKKQQAMR
ncbi:hypothetical protein EVAR_97226_1 [Eumeta japonica]|uniref:Uncharacterized protein n=1 Tax=Eumeta variegata TaxID=151549 RepID=A0A4C2A650_EUMVA|nr:hypothetical protein EVAR_97226_1 [Eumeta japonica]